uniref:FZ domain-containing protein n=1 Tax=Steinernema glaseri TaxID=37863 RepID=A0A1I7Y0E8_9BILA
MQSFRGEGWTQGLIVLVEKVLMTSTSLGVYVHCMSAVIINPKACLLLKGFASPNPLPLSLPHVALGLPPAGRLDPLLSVFRPEDVSPGGGASSHLSVFLRPRPESRGCLSQVAAMPLLAFFCALLALSEATFLSEGWTMLAGDKTPSRKCVDIPRSFSLCHGMQYTQMRLPNLLDHETLEEATEQSSPWSSLTALNCHADTQLFLCSLFAPVCLPNLDNHILPCRSLCESVQQGCESRMVKYGFAWPEMLKCSKYPEDNDMCIKAVNTLSQVIKARLSSVNDTFVGIRKSRSLKRKERKRSALPRNAAIRFWNDKIEKQCPCPISPTTVTPEQQPSQDTVEDDSRSSDPSGGIDDRYLIMANKVQGIYIANLILPWQRHDKSFKKALRTFRKLNCHSLGREIRESAIRRSLPQKKKIH